LAEYTDNMNSLFSLPFSLFSHIRDFVVLPSIDETQDERNQAFQDWRNFCNCSNHQVLQEIKARFSFYNLNLTFIFRLSTLLLEQGRRW
jgi:hypothetical protein